MFLAERLRRKNDFGLPHANLNLSFALPVHGNRHRRFIMPVFVVPLLIGVPVLIGGGYLILKVLH
jgi:hypothetical protein